MTHQDLRKGDMVKARLVLETRLSPHSRPNKRRVDLLLRPQAIIVVSREKKMDATQESAGEIHWEGSDERVTIAPVSDNI